VNSNDKHHDLGKDARTGLPDGLRLLLDARHHDPFAVLGRHPEDGAELFRALLPEAESARIGASGPAMERLTGTDLFECRVPHGNGIPEHYSIFWEDKAGRPGSHVDPYTFPPQIADFDLYLFGEGKHRHIYRVLGSHVQTVDGVEGVLFATWAPNAERVSVVGDFNGWDGRLRRRDAAQDRVAGGAHRHVPVGRQELSRPPQDDRPAARADVDLRGAPRLMAALG